MLVLCAHNPHNSPDQKQKQENNIFCQEIFHFSVWCWRVLSLWVACLDESLIMVSLWQCRANLDQHMLSVVHAHIIVQ